jgi:hypothetical protein
MLVFHGSHSIRGFRKCVKWLKPEIMKASVVFFIVLITTASCRESVVVGEGSPQALCGGSNPLMELDWLRYTVEQINTQTHTGMDMFVYSATYEGRRVFFVDICCPACNFLPPEIIDCEGQSLGRLFDGISPDDVVNRSVIWRTENGVCTRD